MNERNIHDEFKSNIRIIFNTKFKIFIKDIKNDIHLIDGICNTDNSNIAHNMRLILETQQSLREYIVNNQHLIDVNGKITLQSKSYPDIFAIMICIIVPKLDTFESFNDVFEETEKDKLYISLYSEQDEGDTFAGFRCCCACGQSCLPQNMFVMSCENNKNYVMNILVGDVCISKTKFIEPEIIKKLENDKIKNKTYKKFIEIFNKQNKDKYINKVHNSLINLQIDINKYRYIGGNFGDHETNFNFYRLTYEHTHREKLEEISEYNIDKCDLCKESIERFILLSNDDDEVVSLCVKCGEYLKKIKKRGICDDCGEKHRNRNDNYCNACRKNKTCIKCKERHICDQYQRCESCCNKYVFCNDCNVKTVLDNLSKCYDCYDKLKSICIHCKERDICDVYQHCKSCSSNKIFCKTCFVNTVKKEGYRCNSCFNKLKVCDCGKKILHNRYNECYKCYTNKC